MKTSVRGKIDVVRVALVVGCAAIAAVAAGVALSAIATPAKFPERLAAVDADIREAGLVQRKRPAPGYPPDGVCLDSGPDGIGALRSGLQQAAGAQRLDRIEIEVSPNPTANPTGLTALNFRLDGDGPYDRVLAALQGLSAVRPMVLIEAVDLESKTSFVTLSVRGRAFCTAN